MLLLCIEATHYPDQSSFLVTVVLNFLYTHEDHVIHSNSTLIKY